jgi:4-hydroxybenzoate polyprenyltransferase
MSTATSPVRRYSRILLHIASVRGVEVCVLQASPLLGAWLGGLDPDVGGLARLGLLLVASVALTAHVFVFNDWAGYHGDAHDARRASLGSGGADISRDQIARVAIVLLVIAGVAFVAVGGPAMLFAAAIATLSLVYSLAPRFGKSTPVAASLNHLAGGALHFLMGYTLVHAVDAKGVALSLFFGLVFAAGHLNQEVRDYEADRANGLSTSAVVFGCRRSFLASFCLFTAAYALVAGMAATGMLPSILLVTAVVWLLQAWWSFQALRRGLRLETALWMQRRYRWLFALVGLIMFIR